MAMAQERRRWTTKEDDILKIVIGEDAERIDWLSVAEHLPGRNNKECRKRWHQKFAANKNHGSWTEPEDERLRIAIGQHGTKWALVARDVGTRNSEQCSKRWNDVLNPDLNRSPWTHEDDNLLMSSVDTYGRNWKKIAEFYFQNRAALSLKNRHALLLRREARENQNREIPPDSSGPWPFDTDSGIGSGPRRGTRTTTSGSSHSSPSDIRDADELGSLSDNENDNQDRLLHRGHGRTVDTNEAGPSSRDPGNGLVSFEPNCEVPIDIPDYNWNDEVTRLMDEPSFSSNQLQQSHQQRHIYPDMPFIYPSPAGIAFPIPPTPPSAAPPSTMPSADSESWEDFLCLGIRCPRKGLEAFKLSVLEAVTKVPGCQDDDGDEKIQIMLKIRKQN